VKEKNLTRRSSNLFIVASLISFQEYVTALEAKNHTTEQFSLGESVVVGITVGENGTIYANSDFRKQGSVAGY
jgi:gamma-glutamyltranspeptidase